MDRTMLVVDDEEPILFALNYYFSPRGFRVDCAREIEEAEALLANGHYSIVIADLRLTGIHGAEGLEIVSYVRERAADTKVILLTAYGTPEIERLAYERGADAFLQKPQRLPAIARLVETLMAGDAVSSGVDTDRMSDK
ncbi:MAG: response regulator [Thermoanaerobaculia bacterium]